LEARLATGARLRRRSATRRPAPWIASGQTGLNGATAPRLVAAARRGAAVVSSSKQLTKGKRAMARPMNPRRATPKNAPSTVCGVNGGTLRIARRSVVVAPGSRPGLSRPRRPTTESPASGTRLGARSATQHLARWTVSLTTGGSGPSVRPHVVVGPKKRRGMRPSRQQMVANRVKGTRNSPKSATLRHAQRLANGRIGARGASVP